MIDVLFVGLEEAPVGIVKRLDIGFGGIERLRGAFHRSFMFLNLKNSEHPAAIIIHDKVTSTNPNFKKTWLLHSIEQPVISGNATTVGRTAGDYDGKLVNTTLLPSSPIITRVGGPGQEYADYDDTNWPETTNVTSSSETGAWRVEVSPSQPALTDTFMNVMQVMDTATAPLPVSYLDFARLEGVTI